MKLAIIFYSLSGNTKRLAQHLHTQLESDKIEVTLIPLVPENEERNFFKQSIQAFLKKEIILRSDTSFDIAEYDCIIFSCAVWAFAITPPLRSYLLKVNSLVNKNVGCILTYGSGTGAKKALVELEDVTKSKGADVVFSGLVQGFKTGNKEYLEEKLAPLIKTLKLSLR